MENNSIREFTCNDCQEVTKVDWSKVRPDLDDGTSNINITFDDGKYIYVGECDNCGNLVEIEPPVPELKVTNVEVDKEGMYIEVTDIVTNRSCWIEAWKDKSGEWEWDYNQYIFHLDDDNDVIAKMFQEDLGNYAEEVDYHVMSAINDHEDEYNKLQENKAPTMRDRLKEAKSKKEEAEDKTIKIMAYGKIYYEYPEDEWKYMSDDHIDSILDDTAFQATQEEGHTVEKDEVEIVTESRKVTEAKDDLGGIKNLTEDITSKDVDEIFSKYAEVPVTVKNLKAKWASASDETHGVYAGGWSAIVLGDNFKININNSLKLNGYKVSGDNIEEAEKVAKNIYYHSADIGYDTGLYEKNVKTESKTLEQEVDKYKDYIGDNTKQNLEKLEKDLLEIDNVTGVDYDLSQYADEQLPNSPIILVNYDQPNTSFKLLKSVIKTIEDNGVKVELDEVEDNDTYFYIVTYSNNWNKQEEAKFKDKVKAIKKSLKKNDKRLSDETAEKSAEKIAGSMVKKEEKTIKTENILDDVREYDVELYDDVIKLLNYYFDEKGIPEEDKESVVTEIQSKFAFDHNEAVDIVNTFIKEYKTKLAGAEKTNLSKEDIKNLLDNGNIIKVGGKVGSTPSKFLEKDGKLYFQNAEISENKFLLHPSSLDEMVDYICNLQKDGYIITSQDWDDTVKIDESKKVTETIDEDKTKVIFRKELEDGDIIAVFPEDKQDNGMIGCYAHMGQHSTMSLDYYKETVPATPEEYKDLKAELENIVGYNLEVVTELDESKKVTESKTSDMDTVDIVMELEGGELTISDVDDWNKVKEVANSLKGSQGFYGRLLRDMLESEKEFGGAENLPFPITM